MQNDLSTDTMWSYVVLDESMTVVEVRNFDDRLFFGHVPTIGKGFASGIGESNRSEVEIIESGISRAIAQTRNTLFTYNSSINGVDLCVCVHVEWRSATSTVCLYLTPVEQEDVRSVQKKSDSRVDCILDKIYDQLPVGLEIYDSHGRLMDINRFEMDILGIDDKKDVLGINIFDNPYLPSYVAPLLRKGENVSFSLDYNFDTIHQYYPTNKSGERQLDVVISVMQDQKGQIERYIVISQDVSQNVKLRQQYERLYDQNATILNSLPVGVGLYSSNGDMLYCNDTSALICGVEPDDMHQMHVNISRNNVIPKELAEAIRKGKPISLHFPCDFSVLCEQGYLKATRRDTIQIECKGQPVVGIDGQAENYVIIMEDVTDRIRNEEILKQSRRKTEIAMTTADTMLWEYDVRQGLFFSDNEHLNDYDSSKPIYPSRYIETADMDYQSMVRNVIERMSRSEEFSFSFDAYFIFPNSPERQYCAVSGSPCERDSNGRITRYVGVRKNNTAFDKRRLLQEKILNSLPLSIHIKDVQDDFRYVFCNDESKKLFGTSEGRSLSDVLDPHEVERIRKTDQDVFETGQSYFGRERIILKDGRKYDAMVHKIIIEDNGKPLLLTLRWDQGLEDELKRRAKLFEITLEMMNAYTWLYEPSVQRIHFGEGFTKIGRRASEINTLEKFIVCIHPDDVQSFVDTLQAVVGQRTELWEIDSRLDFNGDGIYTWWKTRGVLEISTINDEEHHYLSGMTISVEEHKQAEQVLKNNQDELKQLVRQNELILNNTNSGLAYISTDYVVQWENVSVCSTSLSFEAYQRGEVCYRSVHNREEPCDNCVMQRAMQSRQMERIEFNLANNRKVEVLATPVFIENGTIDGIVIRVDDITEREMMIEELHQAKALAEQSDKLKSVFLANMSHEIRTPLNAIVGFSDLLIHTENIEEREEYLMIINNNNDLLLKLINDILDLSKIEAGAVEFIYEDFDLSEYFDAMAQSMRQRITNSNVRLIDINPYKSCRVTLDKNRVAQLLTNFVTNAIKYTPKGFVEMSYFCQEDGVRLIVKDSGIGIAEDKKDKVFQRFAKLDEFAQGTGLGLSICRAIAESMHGSVGFESKQGEGSTFWAFLPCRPDIGEPSESLIKALKPVEIVNGHRVERPPYYGSAVDRKTILIAEDIYSNYLLVSSLLKQTYNIIHAQDGLEALEIVRSEKHKIDMVLMDMKMPRMDGLTATTEIRKINANLPIVALTAHAFESDRLAALAAGCNEYLVKPIDKVRLNEVLERYCQSNFTDLV